MIDGIDTDIIIQKYGIPDEHSREAVADLFRSGRDALTIIRWKDIHEQIEEALLGGLPLALADEEPALAGEILSAAISSVQKPMKEFGPDGAWGEGPSYTGPGGVWINRQT